MSRAPKRPHISVSTKLASCLLELLHLRGQGIPFHKAQKMSTKEILALVEWDHAVYHAIGGGVHPTNLTPRLVADHREKTRKTDIPAIAKIKRMAEARGINLMLIDVTGARDDGANAPRPPVKRAWPKGRKIPSGPFDKKRRAAR